MSFVDLLQTRWRQGHRTLAFPQENPVLPDRLRGLPGLDAAACISGCTACRDACPTDALSLGDTARFDLGRCLFCTDCADACPEGAITWKPEHRLAVRRKEDLLLGPEGLRLAEGLDTKMKALFGRSLKLRQVSAGGCNACEADINVLSTVVFDLGRFGIQIVASPRHADGLLITGPVSRNMELALAKTWAAIPEPKIVIAVGACACSGGPFAGHDEVLGGADKVLPVDLYIPGCPPHPLTILDGLLRLMGRIEASR